MKRTHSGGSGTLSGISIDLLCGDDKTSDKISHVKCLWGKNKKIPKYIKNGQLNKIVSKDCILKNIYFTDCEKATIACEDKNIYFRNGIDIFSDKHKLYKYTVYYLEVDNHNMRDYIEISWRKKYGMPQLCSYESGR